MIVPEAFAAVFESATEFYSGLSEASAEPLAPIGYHEWPGGACASDGYRVHLRGRMPSFGWVELLHSEADDWDFGDWRVGRGLIEWLESVAEVPRETPIFFEESGLTTDMLDGPWSDAVDTYWPECPLVVEGFGIRAQYLLDALRFVLPGGEGEVFLFFRQGLFLLVRDDDGSPESDSMAYVAGFRYTQWSILDKGYAQRSRSSIGSGELAVLSPIRSGTAPVSPALSIPFPIAYGYRALSAVPDPDHLSRSQGAFCENMLVFLCCLSLSLVRPDDRAEVDLVPPEFWGRGVSLGSWRDLFGRCAKVLKRYNDVPLAQRLAELKPSHVESGFGADVKDLIGFRNRITHATGPRGTIQDLDIQCERAAGWIEGCIERLAFLADFPVRHVVTCSTRRDRPASLSCWSLMGDNPLHRFETVSYPHSLHTDELYVQLREDCWVSLDPFLRVIPCPTCQRNEIFFIDRWLKKDGCYELLSFEERHRLPSPPLAAALDQWHGGAEGETGEAVAPVSRRAQGDGSEPVRGEPEAARTIVTVIEGPLTGFAAEVDRVDESRGVAEARVSIFGSPVTVEIGLDQTIPGGEAPWFASSLSSEEQQRVREAVIEVLRSAPKPLKARQVATLAEKTTGVPVTRQLVNHYLYTPSLGRLVEKTDDGRWRLK